VLGPQMAAAMLSDFRTLRRVRLLVGKGSMELSGRSCCGTPMAWHGRPDLICSAPVGAFWCLLALACNSCSSLTARQIALLIVMAHVRQLVCTLL
jgi:hypothetical protein